MLHKIRDQDLVAREAHYHNHCRRKYTREDSRHSTLKESEASKAYDAHNEAFAYISSYIEENILTAQKVERLTMIRERYLQYLLENHPDVYNENYKVKR